MAFDITGPSIELINDARKIREKFRGANPYTQMGGPKAPVVKGASPEIIARHCAIIRAIRDGNDAAGTAVMGRVEIIAALKQQGYDAKGRAHNIENAIRRSGDRELIKIAARRGMHVALYAVTAKGLAFLEENEGAKE